MLPFLVFQELPPQGSTGRPSAAKVPPFGIVHTYGYNGQGGVLKVALCSESQELVPVLQKVVKTWNALEAKTGTCNSCGTEEILQDPVPGARIATDEFDAESTLLHEVGHCAMGLGHPNLEANFLFDGIWEILPSPFTASVGPIQANGFANATAHCPATDPSTNPHSVFRICDGVDGIPGSSDDEHAVVPAQIPESIHWFRKADNNPVVVDSMKIDGTTYSRSVVNNLPGMDSWAAHATLPVSAALGLPNTQAVMYTGIPEGATNRSLTGRRSSDG